MKLGYRKNLDGEVVPGTSKIKTTIRQLEVELLVDINRDVSYPLSSPHNKGFHVKICGTSEAFFTEFNVNDVEDEESLVSAVRQQFDSADEFIMISKALPGETFSYDAQVYNHSAIKDKRYSNWDDDLEDIEDNADQIVKVVLNDHLRWEVVNQ